MTDDPLAELLATDRADDDEAPGRGGGRWGAAALVATGLLGMTAVAGAVLLASLGGPPVAVSAAPSAAPIVPFVQQRPSVTEATPRSAPDRATTRVDAAWATRVAAASEIPERALIAYASAALRIADEVPSCGLGWNTLAGIGHVESEHGTIAGGIIDGGGRPTIPVIGIALNGDGVEAIADTDGGRVDGDAVWDRAVGPMQFIPQSWNEWGADADGDGIADVHHIDDAALAAARYLCAERADLTQGDAWIAAVLSYNDSVDYVNRVADAATVYASAAEAS